MHNFINEELNIDAFKDYFAEQSTLKLEDIIEFSKSMNLPIDQREAKTYLVELEDLNLIRHKARGIYAIEGKDIGEKEYYVILMDVIGSSSYEFALFNKELKEKIGELNKKLNQKKITMRKYFISQGDGIQIFIPREDDFVRLLLLTFAYLYPYKVRYGISVGTYQGEITENSWEMNGPIFWNAKDGLDKLKKKNEYIGIMHTESKEKNRIANSFLPNINKAIDRVSEKQWEAVKYKLLDYSVDESAKELNIIKSSYYDRIDKSNIEEIRKALQGLVGIIEYKGGK